ncbi:MAG: hypothetical protein H7Z74_11485 [Anaerolineae bacterium]|nr:hypothetical protein [Gemmatimonadaceae bacterium]
MKHLFRAFVALIGALATFYFVYWVPFSFIPGIENLRWIPFLGSLASAVVVGRYIWKGSDSVANGFLASVVKGAVVTGGIGFVGGFFGPILFAPEANQGPLLGIFITGPLGFLLGAIGGGIYWFARGRTSDASNPGHD